MSSSDRDPQLPAVTIAGDRVAIARDNDGRLFLRWGDVPGTVPFRDNEPSGAFAPEDQAVLAGCLPDGATTAEVVAPDGSYVQAAVGSGAWLAVVADNHLGIEAYPVLYRDADGDPVPRHVPADWDRRGVSRDAVCPACSATVWDLVTAAWEGEGLTRTTRWGQRNGEPGQAHVCRVCGYAERVPVSWQY